MLTALFCLFIYENFLFYAVGVVYYILYIIGLFIRKRRVMQYLWCLLPASGSAQE